MGEQQMEHLFGITERKQETHHQQRGNEQVLEVDQLSTAETNVREIKINKQNIISRTF